MHYPWYDGDSAFTSSNETLDAVWSLARYTVHAASLDAYSDSNTRERRPYEADGIIAATARLLVQRDVRAVPPVAPVPTPYLPLPSLSVP